MFATGPPLPARPPNFKAAGTVCGAATSTCDPVHVCSGRSPVCQEPENSLCAAQIAYTATLTEGDSIVNITNTGANGALCARDQGQFWKMHDVLYSGDTKLAQPDLLAHAKGLHLDIPLFQSCLDGGKHKAEIAKDIQDASLLGITGTPSFFVGRTTPDGVEGSVVVGALPFGTFDSKLKESETAK